MSRPIREMPPCHDCSEKFTACHDDCPKDKRGEFGYGTWKKKLEQINAERRKYDKKPHVKNYGY